MFQNTQEDTFMSLCPPAPAAPSPPSQGAVFCHKIPFIFYAVMKCGQLYFLHMLTLLKISAAINIVNFYGFNPSAFF